MRYLSIYEDKCIISDVASDMPIIDGMVLGKPICEVINGIFSDYVRANMSLVDPDDNIYETRTDTHSIWTPEYNNKVCNNLLDATSFACRNIGVHHIIHNPYLCIDCKHCMSNVVYMYVFQQGYMEFAWYASKDCPHFIESTDKLCVRCFATGYFGKNIYECIECQQKLPLPALTKCTKCGCIWATTFGSNLCVECDRNGPKQCYGCGLNFYKNSFVEIRSMYSYANYCNKCILNPRYRCFICGSVDTHHITYLLYDNDDLYVDSYAAIEYVLISLRKNSPFVDTNTIREYNKTLFDESMMLFNHVYCHATCVNVVCNLNIISRP